MTTASTDAIRAGLDQAHWTIRDLWIASVGVGGAFTQADVGAIADGVRDATPLEHDILAAAMNDHFTGHGLDHPVEYWSSLAPGDR